MSKDDGESRRAGPEPTPAAMRAAKALSRWGFFLPNYPALKTVASVIDDKCDLLKVAEACQVCERLVAIEDAYVTRTPLCSNQLQALDGYGALANFQALAPQARAVIAAKAGQVGADIWLDIPEGTPAEEVPSILARLAADEFLTFTVRREPDGEFAEIDQLQIRVAVTGQPAIPPIARGRTVADGADVPNWGGRPPAFSLFLGETLHPGDEVVVVYSVEQKP